MPDREKKSSRRQVRYTERISPQESSCTPFGQGKSEYLRLNEENEKENRGEATRRGMDIVEAGESYFVLNPAADRQPVEIKE